MKGRRDPVKKNMDLFQKPKTFRNRKKIAKQDGKYGDQPKHRPYEREHLNYHYLIGDGDDEGLE